MRGLIKGKKIGIMMLIMVLFVQTAVLPAAEVHAQEDAPVIIAMTAPAEEQEQPGEDENPEDNTKTGTEENTASGRETEEKPDPEAGSLEEQTGEENPIPEEEELLSGEDEPEEAEEADDNTRIAKLIEERADEIEQAEYDFAELAWQKAVMAVVYLTDACPVYTEPDRASELVTELDSASTIYMDAVRITENGLFYYGGFFIGQDYLEGYVTPDFLIHADEDWTAWEETYADLLRDLYGDLPDEEERLGAGTGYADVMQFPAGYQASLNKLKNAHPNWTFVPLKTGLDFNEAVAEEMGNKSWIYINDSNIEKGFVGKATGQGKWAYATEAGVSYYMDPRNFLTEGYIFQFEQLTFNSSCHTVDAIQSFLNGTFMKGVLPDQTSKSYAQAFYEIGRAQGVSPTHLATRVYQEQGAGTSPLISGNWSGENGAYKGYYNYFNVGASGSTDAQVILSGLKYAKQKGWNTRYKSLKGGAETIGNGYIKKGQDTGYLQKFNVNPNAENQVYTHQYMQNIQAPASESLNTRKVYADAGALKSNFIFKIPVYSNMPGLRINKAKATINVGDTLQLVVSVNGTALEGSEASWRSSDPGVATVSNGTVTAINPGSTVITAAYDGNEVICNITVKSPIRNIYLDHTSDVMRRTDTIVENGTGLTAEQKKANHDQLQLSVTYEPVNTTDEKSVTWVSGNNKVATVDASGLVKAVGAGTCVITAKAKSNAAVTATCEITVIAPVYKVELTDPAGTELLMGQSRNLVLEYWPKDTTSDTKIAWESNKPLIAGVDNGTVSALSEGSATIKATLAGYSDSISVTVTGASIVIHGGETLTDIRTVNGLSCGRTAGEQFEEKGLEWPKDPEINGKAFLGWYSGTNGTGSRIGPDTVITQRELHMYPHFEETGRGFYVVPIGDQTYTGSAIRPPVRVYDSIDYAEGNETTELVEGKDYTVTYANNVKVDAAGATRVPTVSVRGKGNYSGTEKVTFHIVAKALTDHDVKASAVTAAYTGKAIKGSPIVTCDGRQLKVGTDYTLQYPQTGKGAYVSPGVYPVTITGKGGYTGSITTYETITSLVLLSPAMVGKIPNQTYTGGPLTPMPVLTYKKAAIPTDKYTVSYLNNTKIGTATVVITAVEGSGYTGSCTKNFTITGTAISKAKVMNLGARTYGPDVKPDFAGTRDPDHAYVELNGQVLQYSPDGITGDYTVSYKNTEKAGNATVIVTGINGYSGSLKAVYRIWQYDIQADPDRIRMTYHTVENPAAEIPVTDISQIVCQYAKGGAAPVITLWDHAFDAGSPKALQAGTDYRIALANTSVLTDTDPQPAKLPTLTIIGRGNYKGRITGNYRIETSVFSDAKISIKAPDKVYAAAKGAWKSVPVLTDANGKVLKAGTDYTDIKYTYAYLTDPTVERYRSTPEERSAGDDVGQNDIPGAGTVISVSVTGKGRYEQTQISATYRIVKASLTNAKYRITGKKYDNGHELKLTEEDIVFVRVGRTDLTYGTDYVIDDATYVYPAGWGAGTVKVILRATEDGNYGGYKEISYTIGSKLLAWIKEHL